MWKQLRHDSSRSSSSTSVLAAFAQSSPTASVRSSKSIQPSQQPSELKDLQELLNFHKGLVQNLGHDLVEMDKLKYLSLKQESRLDTQQATIERLSSQNTHYKRRVAELETQVREDKARINELITSIKNLRKFNVQSQKSGDHMVPLDGIIKDALIEQFESDVERLTQQVFDHDRETQALVSLHERDVGDLERRIESLRNDLRHEQSVVTMHMRSQAKITKARQAVQQSDLNRQALDSLGKSGGASARDETLTQALAHTKELSRSERLTTDGKEIELHHMQNLCGVAQAQAEEIALLRAANTDLLAANTMQEEKEDQVKTSIADVHPPAHRRNVTWDLPLRNTKREVEPRTPSRLRKRWAVIPSLHNLAPPPPPPPCSPPFPLPLQPQKPLILPPSLLSHTRCVAPYPSASPPPDPPLKTRTRSKIACNLQPPSPPLLSTYARRRHCNA